MQEFGKNMFFSPHCALLVFIKKYLLVPPSLKFHADIWQSVRELWNQPLSFFQSLWSLEEAEDKSSKLLLKNYITNLDNK